MTFMERKWEVHIAFRERVENQPFANCAMEEPECPEVPTVPSRWFTTYDTYPISRQPSEAILEQLVPTVSAQGIYNLGHPSPTEKT